MKTQNHIGFWSQIPTRNAYHKKLDQNVYQKWNCPTIPVNSSAFLSIINNMKFGKCVPFATYHSCFVVCYFKDLLDRIKKSRCYDPYSTSRIALIEKSNSKREKNTWKQIRIIDGFTKLFELGYQTMVQICFS